ncbi:MAG TPA: hypothetical protein VLF71_00620 [Candidatus Saccharimonadales bacterium]|nr:hypothetical protein [Candidatus Saccharimonadales bacterium]
MNGNTYPTNTGNIDPDLSEANRLLTEGLRAETTEYHAWGVRQSDPNGANAKYTAKITELGTVIDMTASQLSRRLNPGVRAPMIVTTWDSETGERQKWAFDGDVLFKLPPQDRNTQQFPVIQVPLNQVQSHDLPTQLAIQGNFGRPDKSNMLVASVTVGHDVVQAGGMLGYDVQFPSEPGEHLEASPFENVTAMVDDVRGRLGLPAGNLPAYPESMANAYGA